MRMERREKSIAGGRAKKISRLMLAASPVVIGLASSQALGTSLTWDAGGTHPTAPVDGSGFWDTTTSWWTSGISPDVGWDNLSTAIFGNNNGTAPYTVTIDDLSGTIRAAGLTFNPAGNGSNYTIAASGADTLTLSGTNPIISVSTGVSASIMLPIAGAFGSSTGTNNTTGLIIKGLGTLTLSGANTYTGSTIIENNGTANTGTAVALSTGSLGSSGSNVYIAFNPTAAATDTSSLTMSGTASLTAATLTLDYNFGEGSISTSSGGVLNVNGNNTINANTITTTAGRANGNTKGGLGTLQLGNGATLTLNGAGGVGNNVTLLDIANYSFENGGSTGTGTSGTVDFSAGTVNGSITTVNIATGKAGAGITANDPGPATGVLDFANGSLTIGTINLARLGNENATGTLNLVAGGTGTITAGTGAGSQAITFGAAGGGTQAAANTASIGAINISGATLLVNGDIVANPTGSAFFTKSSSTINLTGGTLNMQGNNIGPSGNAITLTATAGMLENVASINASGNGSAGLTTSGTISQVLTLTGTNSYTGTTTIGGDTVIANGAASMGAGGALAVNSGTLDLDGFSHSVAGLSGTGAGGIITNNGVSLPVTLTVTGGTGTYAGVIKDGSSTTALTLTGGAVNFTSAAAQTYTGNTNVNSGATLTMANINSITNTTVNGSLAAVGTLGTLLLDQGGSLTPGPTVASNSIGTLNASTFTLGSGGGSLNFLVNSLASFDQLSVSGLATLNGGLTVNASLSSSAQSGTYAAFVGPRRVKPQRQHCYTQHHRRRRR